MVSKVVSLVTLGSLLLAAAAFGSSQLPSATTNVAVTAGKRSDLRFTLSKTAVPKGTVVFKVTKPGNESKHDFNRRQEDIAAHAREERDTQVTLAKAGKYRFLCTVPGHAAAGMRGVLAVR